MIRWKFLLTRLLVVAAIVTLLRWGLGPAARYLTIQGVQLATGARVDIERTEIGLFPPRLHYTGLQVADPRGRKEFRDLFRANSVDLQIDGEALLHRRWVVRSGRITGLEVGTRREESGHFDRDDSVVKDDADQGPSLLGRLMGGAMEGLEGEVSDVLGDLETIRRSEQIRRRWKSDYASLVSQARGLERQVREIRDQAGSIKNPLRDYQALDRAIAQTQQVRTELAEVRAKIDALPQQFQSDLESLDEAKRIDLAKVEAYVPESLRGTDGFAGDLLVRSVRERLQQLQEYLDHGREIANLTVVAPKQQRVRGETFDLSGGHQPPSILIRQCELSGLLQSQGRVYSLRGIVDNLTPAPQQLREPTRARLMLEDIAQIADPIRLDYVCDRRNGTDHDQITLLWPRRDARPMQLGKGNQVAISVAGGKRELWAQIVREGGAMRGRLVSKQTELKMQLQVAPQYARSPIATTIGERLSQVDRIEIDARFAGTWDDLDLKLESNLERVLRQATDEAIAAQVNASRQKIAESIRRRHSEQKAELQQWLGDQQAEARTLLASADRSIEEMFQKVTRGIGSADAYLGRVRASFPSGLRR